MTEFVYEMIAESIDNNGIKFMSNLLIRVLTTYYTALIMIRLVTLSLTHIAASTYYKHAAKGSLEGSKIRYDSKKKYYDRIF